MKIAAVHDQIRMTRISQPGRVYFDAKQIDRCLIKILGV